MLPESQTTTAICRQPALPFRVTTYLLVNPVNNAEAGMGSYETFELEYGYCTQIVLLFRSIIISSPYLFHQTYLN